MNDPPNSPGREVLAGIKAVLPLLIGAAPFGLIYGVLATGTGLPPAAAQAMSLLVFAGAAQFVAVGLLDVGAPGAIVLLTTFVINLRHMLYSASLAPHLRPLRPAWKWGLAFLITDEAYALGISRYRAAAAQAGAARGHSHAHWYLIGAGLVIYVVWQISTAVGIALGTQVPAAWGLDFTLPLTFIGLLAPILNNRGAVAAAIAAGVMAVA
ncbi:MAG: AzlC family ABC transporter permease, partial [bacterium]